jgi:Schlafen, AlbA_2
MKKNSKIILVHIVLGISVFYFLVHPFTAVLYWFEYANADYSFQLFTKILKDQLLDSFSFGMIQMSASLTALGGFLGLLSGLLWINFNKKQKLIKKQEHIIKRDVQKLIELGENDWVEFKSSMKYDYFKNMPNRGLELVIAKTIAGFMNAKGGKLIVGIDDDGKFLGLENDYKTLKHANKDGYERNIFKIISNFIGQEFCYKNHVAFYQFNEKDVCLIDVESSQIPAYVTDGKNTTFYVRTGNATHPLSVKEAVKYLENRKN